MKNFLSKQREVIALLSYVAIVACLIYLVIMPLIASLSDMNDQIQQESMNQESVELHIGQLSKIQKQYDALQDSGDLSGVLLDKNKAVILIERLEKLAESTNNKIAISIQEKSPTVSAKKIVPKTTTSATSTLVEDLPSADYLQMKITLTGDYNSVAAFVNLLEKFEYYADITAIQIGKYKEPAIAQPKQSLSNSGMFSGVIQPVKNSINTKLNIAKENMLTASFDTVFYTN